MTLHAMTLPGMTLHRLALAAPLAALLALAPAPLLACTPAPGYRVPTNLELAGQANLILIGRVLGQAPAAPLSEGEAIGGGIAVEPIAALKGLLPGGPLTLRGMIAADAAAAGPPGDPEEFDQAHPQAYAGGCIRRVFPAGATVLFFLRRQQGEWVPAGGPFSRWAEDVSGPEAPWARLAALYARAAQLPAGQRAELLQGEIEALQANQEDALALRLASDIERQLAGPNEPLVPPLPEPSRVERQPERLGAVQRGLDALSEGAGSE